jgi:phosphatidate cytidylyltransferase
MADRGDREGGDDLFEDLDKYFAAIDENDWPEPSEETAAPATPGAESRSTPEAPTPETPPPGEPPTAEMGTQEWTRLRDVLGDDNDENEEMELLSSETGAAADDPLYGYGAEEEEGGGAYWEPEPPAQAAESFGAEEPEPQELTLEDLKKAPPEYRDLPTESQPEPVDDDLPDPLAADLPSEPREPIEPAEVPADLTSGEPSLADVEAVADHLAGEPGEEPEDHTASGVEDDLLADLTEPTGPRTVRVGEPEEMVGPTWEEPTSHPVSAGGGPRFGSSGGRNLPLAVTSAAVLGILALIFLFVAKWLFAILAGAVVLWGQNELYVTMRRRGYQPATALGLVLGGLTLAGAYFKGEAAMLFMVALSLAMTFLWYMAAPVKARVGTVGHVGATMVGVLYAPLLASYILLILTLPNSGRALMLAVLGLTFLYDVAAFFFGSIWGSRPLAPSISPKKSWEGLLGATVVTLVVAFAFVYNIGPMTAVRAIGLGLTICIFAPLGDLAESALKRDLGVKDMGTILPGHGGVLDRIDSVLLVAPAAFYFLRLIF